MKLPAILELPFYELPPALLGSPRFVQLEHVAAKYRDAMVPILALYLYEPSQDPNGSESSPPSHVATRMLRCLDILFAHDPTTPSPAFLALPSYAGETNETWPRNCQVDSEVQDDTA